MQKETPATTSDVSDDRYQIIDMLTGITEPIKVYEKKAGERWDKVWARSLADLLDLSGESRTKIIAYLIRKKDYKNVIMATIRKIAEDTEVSTKTVNRTLLQLEEAKFIIRLQNGAIMFSPHIIQPGKSWQGVAVMRRWKSEQETDQ